MLKIDKAHLRGFWVASSERRYGFYRFTLDPFSHYVSPWLISTFLLPHGSVIAGLWMVSRICENVARAACTQWSRGSWLGGASVSALCLCCFLAHRFCMALSCCCWFAFVFTCHTNPRGDIQCYHLFWYVSAYHELTCWSPAVLFLFGLCLFCLCFCSCFLFGCFVLVCGLAQWQLNGLCIDLCSVLLLVHFVIGECCHCINSLNLPICISFRLD